MTTKGCAGEGHRCQRRWRLALICTASLLVLLQAAVADDIDFTRNTFGTVGLVEMPSARLAPDGTLMAGASFFENNQRYVLGFQALPWLETDFRYAGLTHFNPSYPVYFDRSFAVKARLWQESEFLPAAAIGVNDVVGTGVYSGEYLVFSKQFGAVDATLGMGWGRLASTDLLKNPLTLISSSFAIRDTSNGVAGGTNFGTLFHGPKVGIFGGISWTTPIDGLTLTTEYSSDRYDREKATGNLNPRSQVNFGADYKFDNTTALKLYWLYGDTIGGSLFFNLSPVDTPAQQRLGEPPPMPQLRTPEQQMEALSGMRGLRNAAYLQAAAGPGGTSKLVDALWQANLRDVLPQGDNLAVTVPPGDPSAACTIVAQLVATYGAAFRTVTIMQAGTGSAAHCLVPTLQAARAAMMRQTQAAAIAAIRKDAGVQQIRLEAVLLGDSDAAIYYVNMHYEHETEALDRLLRILMKDAPPEIERFRFIAINQGDPAREFTALRSPAEREFDQTGDLPLEHLVTADSAPLPSEAFDRAVANTYPRFNWSIYPQLRQEFFDPSNPVGVALVGGAVAQLDLFRGLTLSAEADATVFDTFNTARPSDSLLPHVRTDFLQYVKQGRYGIGQLKAEYRFRIASDVFAVARAGYLEDMFAGIGGEVLWRPEGQRWALGADLYEVEQRDFNRLFGLQPYHVMTGHVSLYYASPWYGLNFELRAGRYLAGDQGITFQATRRFDSGVEIGAFMTKTNVSAAQFGEGSFDKGIVIRIPLNWLVPIHTQSELLTILRPVQRDGGQTLLGDESLYEETRRVNYETFGGR